MDDSLRYVPKNIDDYKRYLKSMDYDSLSASIKNFLSLDFSTISDEEITSKLYAILHNDFGIIMDLFTNNIAPFTMFFVRLRSLIDKTGIGIDESWYREPSEYVRAPSGRFDFRDKPVLYTAFSLGGALYETNLSIKDPFVEVVFTNKKQLNLITLGKVGTRFLNSAWNKGLSELETKIATLLNDFVFKLLSWNDPSDTTHRLSRIAARVTLRDVDADGILYPSVKDSKGFEHNVAFFDSWDSLSIEYATIHMDSDIKYGYVFNKQTIQLTDAGFKEAKQRYDRVQQWYRKIGFEPKDFD